MSETRSYPRHAKTDAGDIEFRPMSRADEAAVLDFAQKLPTHELLFLPRNISQPKVLSAWINEIERGAITSLLAGRAGKVVGCGTLVRDPHSWSPHVGEIRMVVALEVRGQGVGRALSQETLALALDADLEKLLVQMTVISRRRSRCSRASASKPKHGCATMCRTLTARSTISSCWGTMWRRSGLK
jgi:N-acetylglutamate synthase-like GNAT family acetyltransferase